MTGEEVVAIRRRLGLTQVQLAARLGVHPITVAKWEVGMQAIRGPTVVALQFLAKQAKPTKRRRK